MLKMISFFTCLLFLTCCDRSSSHEAEIRNQVKAYEDAYNKKDVKALSLLWAENAEYIDPESGEEVRGRREIEKELEGIFQKKEKNQLVVHVESITFPKTGEAIETGTAVISQDSKEISRKVYKATYVLEKGKWLLQQVREVEVADAPKQNEPLKELSWLIGDWEDQDDDATILSNYTWDRYKNFIVQQFSVSIEGSLEIEGRQLIGWDPIEKKIRSWLFDSDGSFGEGVWRKEGKVWTLEMQQTLTDGRSASMNQIFKPVDQDHYKWESSSREIDGELLPDIAPITIIRKKG